MTAGSVTARMQSKNLSQLRANFFEVASGSAFNLKLGGVDRQARLTTC